MQTLSVAHEWSAVEYRQLTSTCDMVSFNVRVKQTDLRISAASDLTEAAYAVVRQARAELEAYIARHEAFLTSLEPVAPLTDAPQIALRMIAASRRAGVGPMAAVAGTIAEHVGREVASQSEEIIVENGGDIWLRSHKVRHFTVLAENTELGGVRFAVAPQPDGVGIATSAGTIGPSLSLGRADAMMIMADTAAYADALATAVGNAVHAATDIPSALQMARAYGARAAVVMADGALGAFGEIELLE